jgi:hypothetical protein
MKKDWYVFLGLKGQSVRMETLTRGTVKVKHFKLATAMN